MEDRRSPASFAFPANHIYYDSESTLGSDRSADKDYMVAFRKAQYMELLHVLTEGKAELAVVDETPETDDFTIEIECFDPIDVDLETVTITEPDRVKVVPSIDEDDDDVVFVRQYKYKPPKQAKKSSELITPPRRNPRRQVQLQKESAPSIKSKSTTKVTPANDLKPEVISKHETHPILENTDHIPKLNAEDIKPSQVEPKATKRRNIGGGRRKRAKTGANDQPAKLTLAQSSHRTLHFLLAYSKSVNEFNRLLGAQKTSDLCPKISDMLSDACVMYMLTNTISPNELANYLKIVHVSENLDEELPPMKEA